MSQKTIESKKSKKESLQKQSIASVPQQVEQAGQDSINQDLQNRIDTSDQDENASYEDLNDDDLKSHNGSDDKYSEIDSSELEKNTIQDKNQES